ncbi:MAG TPA: DUF3306 domain-containing protein [Rubrivivax sp.]|nr:DUF3306 domain-containing protein [Rubrivivax sp.]
MRDSDSSFLSRWSRRKAQLRDGAVLPDEAAAPRHATTAAGAEVLAPVAAPAAPAAPQPPQDPVPTPPTGVVPPAPTLADVAALSAQSDYTRFVARGVTPEVKNAALKKLFADPHFNLMDGLDTYIDDYGKPDPLPAGMLRQMVQSHLLRLFDDDKENDSELASPAMPNAAPDMQPAVAAARSTAADLPSKDAGPAPPPQANTAHRGTEPGTDPNT